MVSVVVYTGEFIEDSSTWPDNAQIVKVTVAYANALFNTTQQIQGGVLQLTKTLITGWINGDVFWCLQ